MRGMMNNDGGQRIGRFFLRGVFVLIIGQGVFEAGGGGARSGMGSFILVRMRWQRVQRVVGTLSGVVGVDLILDAFVT